MGYDIYNFCNFLNIKIQKKWYISPRIHTISFYYRKVLIQYFFLPIYALFISNKTVIQIRYQPLIQSLFPKILSRFLTKDNLFHMFRFSLLP